MIIIWIGHSFLLVEMIVKDFVATLKLDKDAFTNV
jgi:hypothetical protein